VLKPEQVKDLAQLNSVAAQFGAEVTIIGATALLCFIDLERFTMDVDLAIALDLADFAAFSAELEKRGWIQEPRREHRWHAPGGSMVDLMPAGPNLRAARQIVWPKSEFAMSLVGFGHVFARSVDFPVAKNMRCKVAPPPVIALLKIIAYMDDPYRRQKDLLDLRALFRRYEDSSDRIFGDEVFAAQLEDIDYANAFLLGLDVGSIAADEEAEIVHSMLGKQQMPADVLTSLDPEDPGNRHEVLFQMQLKAFAKGMDAGRLRTK
jgi:predicted nucleotidyltransferase